MKSKKLFFSVCLALILSLFCFVSCTGGTTGATSEKESSSITGESISVESESEISSESESEGISLTVPTFAIDEITATPTSLSFTYTENDPDEVGEITEIRAEASGKDAVYAENLEDCEVKGLYSVTTYTLVVEYTYDVGDGEVSKEYKKNKSTLSLKKPTVELSAESTTFDCITFELNITDPDQIAVVKEIKLVPEEGEEIILEDLSLRAFEGIESGVYTLEVYYEYDLNRGNGATEQKVSISVSTKINPLSLVDFTVVVEEGRDPIVLQISDTQIIDASQCREGRESSMSYYGPDKIEARMTGFIRETVTAVKPDLILITGDLVYGEFDDKGTSLLTLIDIMDSFKIPWAPIFGNHDNESKKGVDWQCEQLENSEFCLFKQRTLTGNGNYTVGIVQGGKLTRAFFMMDSNGCGNVSAESLANGHTTSATGFGIDQINWFVTVGELLNKWSPETKISFAFHIQIAMFETAYEKYGFTNSNTADNPINIETHENRAETDFGYIGKDLKGEWDRNNMVYDKMKDIGVDSIFVGHEHCNSASVVYDGVRFQFGQKISMYDRCNWLKDDGTIVGVYNEVQNATPIMGGSVIVLSKEDGSIKDGYIYYCGGIDPLSPKA